MAISLKSIDIIIDWVREQGESCEVDDAILQFLGIAEAADDDTKKIKGFRAKELRNVPSFIFKLQRLGKVVEITDDGVRISQTELKPESKVKLSDEGKKAVKPPEPPPVPEVIEPNYYWVPPVFPTIEKALIKKDVVFLYGMPGLGKDELLSHVGSKHNWETEKFELNGDMSKEDIFGFFEYKEGVGTVFTDGIVPRCMKKGIFLIIDEIDVGPMEILVTMQKMLEKNSDNSFKTLYNPMNGEQVVAHEGFRLAATGNTCGKGDETSLFPATHPLNDAFLDRFPLVIRMDYPPESVEADIIRKTTGLDRKKSGDVAKLAAGVRAAFRNQKLYSTFSMRRSKNLSKMIKDGVPMKDALKYTVLDRVGQEDANAIIGIAKEIFGNGVIS